MSPTTPPTPSQASWESQVYEDLMTEAARLETAHRGLPADQTARIRHELEELVLTCSFLPKPHFAAFATDLRHMCAQTITAPAALQAFLPAAWKACEADANGVRPIPRKAEIEAQARDFRRQHFLDEEQSWAYEGLKVKFRSDLEEGEDPLEVAKSYAKPPPPNLEELRAGIRHYIESGGLEAKNARLAAEFEKQQALERQSAKAP